MFRIILFLTAGLVPWFYFSEALTSAMVSLLEYNYLVKKVVFKISILPVIKIIAATIYSCVFRTGFTDRGSLEGLLSEPVYTAGILLQLLHVRFCTGTQLYDLLGLSSFSGICSPLFNIFLQVGMWATPVLWNINDFPMKLQMIVKTIRLYTLWRATEALYTENSGSGKTFTPRFISGLSRWCCLALVR